VFYRFKAMNAEEEKAKDEWNDYAFYEAKRFS
jgi:hypothetical protein